MLCPKCHSSHKYSAGMTCSCGYKFLFSPKGGGAFTDNRFLNLVDKASANDTYYFTLPQLESRWARRSRRKSGSTLAWGVGVALAGVCFAVAEVLWLAAILCVIGLVLALTGRSGRTGASDTSDVPRAVARWTGDGRPLDKLIGKPSLQQPPPEWREADIYDYGVERILIVERDILVDLFVRNQFHAEQKTLVMSESGYPPYLEKPANQSLADSANTQVFLLHDATVAGLGMAQRLRQSGRLKLPEDRLVDMGLFPADIERFTKLDANAAPHQQVDFLPYRPLANLIALSMERGVPFSQLPKEDVDKYDDGGFFG